MPRKIISGPVRDKERTKKKLINSVGRILKKEGFADLSVTKVAIKAKLHRRLIYEYFGGLEGLVTEYLNSRDYWRKSMKNRYAIIEKSRKDFGKQMMYKLLEDQFDSLMKNAEMRQIITWGLSENLTSLQELNKQRELFGEDFFTEVTDDFFKDKDKNIRTIEGILVAGIYYLTLQAKMNYSTMCGVDINSEDGKAQIKKTLKQIIEWAYS